MRTRRGLAALVLALCLLAGCASPAFSGSSVETAGVESLIYAPCDEAEGLALAEDVAAFARTGGSDKDFQAANGALVAYLKEAATMDEIAALRSAADAADEALGEESLRASALYRRINDAYWDAMGEVATSPYRGLLETCYDPWQIRWFEQDDGDTEVNDLYDQEDALCRRYRELMAADTVDEATVKALFLELVALRQEIARQEGYDSYADYAYESIYARSYTPEDAQVLWQAAREHFAPKANDSAGVIYEQTESLLYTSRIDCSPEAIVEAVEANLDVLGSREITASFARLRREGLYDITCDSAKAHTGYTTYLYAMERPFLFNAAAGCYYDYTDFIHEFGHFANYDAVGCDFLFGGADNDLAELQSQGMEVMLLSRYEDIFGGIEGSAIRRETLLDLFYSVADGALFDEFLQAVYSREGLTAAEVDAIFDGLCEDYGFTGGDWIDLEHNFLYPFYYISYAAGAAAALELYQLSLTDGGSAATIYRTLSAMDCQYWYFTDALAEVGLGDVFDPAVCAAAAQIDLLA